MKTRITPRRRSPKRGDRGLVAQLNRYAPDAGVVSTKKFETKEDAGLPH